MSMFVYVGEGRGRGLVYVEKFPKICSLFIRKNSENRAFLLHMYIFFYRNHEISLNSKIGVSNNYFSVPFTVYIPCPFIFV